MAMDGRVQRFRSSRFSGRIFGSLAPVPATTIKPDLSLAMIHDVPNKTGGRTANESNNIIYSLLLSCSTISTYHEDQA